uniref:Uncharacterized protein n=1 Tax=Myoviridae sp. ctLnO19 TaxID=2825085 RepID=A0A8S5P147_9CAUD|nr:MAG TPA: hypothetical protein [Myoviridae sp. ctLnO19]DAJ69092.1 MAG TPA: hypothetical protein [Caudoviricetes sp.]
MANLKQVFTQIGADIKGLKAGQAKVGDLTTLNTTDKTTLVAAVNEALAAAKAGGTEDTTDYLAAYTTARDN